MIALIAIVIIIFALFGAPLFSVFGGDRKSVV